MNVRALAIFALAATLLVAGCASAPKKRMSYEQKQRLMETNIRLAEEYMMRNKLDFAMERVEQALALDPDSSRANNMMALLQWQMKQYDKAEDYFERAVDLDPRNSEAQNNYGVFLCERGRVRGAEERFKKALQNPLYKTPGDAYLNAGLCLMKEKAYDEAAGYLRQALKYNPHSSAGLLAMAKVSYINGEYLRARAFIQRHMAVSEDTPENLKLAIKIEQALGGRNAEASYRLRLNSKFPQAKNKK